ncbi:hypothetical protein SAMN04488122_0919 [Chitinophaga arvensicola]|uniref:Uncharacterized protein n=1 Tax=Chitinophaga arvensicola TaxID=29529 RepID=A0A1I0PQQ8_9BACT|nr:hypothetical protein SAMN04488122_0919 [Chitinophaga arvensicola]
MKPSYYRQFNKEQRSRIMLYEVEPHVIAANIITYYLPPPGYRDGRWDKNQRRWDTTDAQQCLEYENFRSRLIPCNSIEYQTAQLEQKQYYTRTQD